MAANAGRKAKPAALKLVDGRRPGKDSGGREVKAPPGFVRLPPTAPEWLGPHARDLWDEVVPELQRLELTKPIDGPALSAYCEMWDLFVVATEEVHSGGLVVENRSVKKDGTESVWYTANPAVGVQKSAQAAMRAWCSEFGLTPAAEGKVGKPEAVDGSEGDPFG